MHQFDSDHALDVHRARLYPFDTYQLTSNIRILSTTTDKTLPITKLPISTHTDSFLVKSTDSPCYIGQTDNLSRILSLTIQRPGEAKAFALLLFAVNWVLAHASIAYTFLILKVKGSDKVLKYLAFVAASLLLIPQLRDAMPDAPGFDGTRLP